MVNTGSPALMGIYWTAAKGIAKGTRTAAESLSRNLERGSQQRTIRRGRQAASHGILGPGSPDPAPGGGDYYDYRGVAHPRMLSGWRDAPYSLGWSIDPIRGPSSPIGIDDATLARHAAVIGPTGSGKTKSILVPWAAQALRLSHSVVMVDVSGDLLHDLDNNRRTEGPFNARVAKWDYTDPSRSLSWNWLAELHDPDALVATVEAIIGRDQPNDPQPFFRQRDRRLLRGTIELLLAANPSATSNQLLALVQDQRALTALANRIPNSAGTRRVADILHSPSHEYGRVVSGVVNALEPFEHPGVIQVTNNNPTTGATLTLATIFDQPTLLVIGAPLHGSRTSETLSSLILALIVRLLYTRFGKASGTHAFLVIDEAPRLKDRLNLEEVLSVSRRARVSACIAAQDVTQFGSPEAQSAILANCNTYVSLPTTSEASAKYLTSRLGKLQQSSMTITQSTGWQQSSQSSVGRTITQADVLGLREVMSPPWSGRPAIVHAPAITPKPIVVDLTRPVL